MWLFGRTTTTTESADNATLNEVTHAQRQRSKQIVWLREKVQSVVELERDRKYQVSFPVNEHTITLDILLSERFPLEGPRVTASPFFVHPWVDNQMIVTGCPSIQQFNPHSNLGLVIKEVITHFTNNPPQFDTSSGIAMATQPTMPMPVPQFSYSPNVPVQYSPYTFSSAPQSVNYLSSNNFVDSPSMPRTSSSPSTAALVDSPRTSSGYSVPAGLPGMSEKSNDDLEKYLNDEDAVVLIDKYISGLDVIKKVQEEMETVFQKNEELARSNLEREPQLQEQWSKLQDKLVELQGVKDRFEKLSKQQTQMTEKYDRRHVVTQLKTFTQEADTESEIIAEDFLDQKSDVASFVQTYLQQRKLYHLRGSKSEMLKYQRT